MTTRTMYQTVGNAVAQWEADSPLCWTMQESAGDTGLSPDPIDCDLTTLISSYDESFLLALKEALISSRHHLKLTTIHSYSQQLKLLLAQVYAKGFNNNVRLRRIDTGFLAALHAAADEIPAVYLRRLKSFFQAHKDDGRLFESTLQPGDFPTLQSKRGPVGDRIHSILAKALRRSTLVHILDVVETAFEEKRIDLGRYAFIRLALNVFCRPSSYHQLTLADLRADKDPETGAINYFLAVLPAKSGVHRPQKINYGLHPEVGRLLALQRQATVERYGNLSAMSADGQGHDRLALFPALRLKADGSSWVSDYAAANHGMLSRRAFKNTYLAPIRKLANTELSFNALRHTIGTQMAMMGCSAHTIQAVLKHATTTTCAAYVDLAFQGLVDELSDALEPSFSTHFPAINGFVGVPNAIPPERRIDSVDLETARVEVTGMCGRHVACSYAPIACYACPRFIPCVEADHSINLTVVEREISFAEDRGLAMQHDVKRWKAIRNYILLVVALCKIKRGAIGLGTNEKFEDVHE
ncbi:tyrosine-type recombinase/integrase [Paraburkholderia youngii]|uniref:Integrase n=1 Tax=Paraburkholderia youngii TaxID=2782701 RepID=A0A7W8LCJ6_9BURK|nr:tyrosine-type recombinase/integrase [Paraburkholderia youngii]MBB5404466.1 integrase [Paraburkholderia youngii]